MSDDVSQKQKKHLLKNPVVWLGCAIVFYLMLMLPQYRSLPLGNDSLIYLGIAENAALDPGKIFRSDYYNRYHPSHFILSSSVYRFMGFDKTAHGAALLAIHTLSAWLLFYWLRRLGTAAGLALFGSVLFLFFSAQWGLMYDFSQLWRLEEAFFMLGALIHFYDFVRSGQKKSWILCLLFFAGALGSGEEAVFLPAFFVLIIFIQPSDLKTRLKQSCLWAGPFWALTLIYFWMCVMAGGVRDSPLSLGWHIALNPFYSVKELIHLFFIPRTEHLYGLPWKPAGIRIFPLLVIAGLTAFVMRKSPEGPGGFFFRLVRDPVFLLGLAIAAGMSLPYLMIAKPPAAEAWPPVRYLYLPGIGAIMMLTALAGRLWFSLEDWAAGKTKTALKFLFLVILGFMPLLNLRTILIMREKINTALLSAAQKEEPIIIAFVNQLRNRYEFFPETAVLVLQNSPLPPARLRQLLPAYYEIRPDQMFISASGQESPEAPVKNGQNIITLKWVAGRLLEA